METLKDKMLKAIKTSVWLPAGNKSVPEICAEACARVAEEEIVRVLDLASIEVDESRSRNTILQLKDKYLSGETVASKEKPDTCLTCGVPLKQHGTCCGWTNASTEVNALFVVTDKNHPGFGQNLNTWKSQEMHNNNWEGLYAIAKAESVDKGKKLYNALQHIAALKEEIRQLKNKQ